MKITIITDAKGDVVGTVLQPQWIEPQPFGSYRLLAGPGQTVHEVELPAHLEGVQSTEEFHRDLKTHLASLKRGEEKSGSQKKGRGG